MRKFLTKKDIGSLIQINFWDHSEGETLVYTEVRGILRKLDDIRAVIHWWETPRDKDIRKDIGECGSIVLSTILSVDRFEKKKELLK